MFKKAAKVVTCFLACMSILFLLPSSVLAADTVECLKTDNTGKTYYAVQISSSGSLKNTKIVAERARDAGYNAFVYHPEGTPRYKIMIGIFTSKGDAASFADIVHDGPEIRGGRLCSERKDLQ